ncbi:hypothetical protein KC853_02890 [Candidatus Saccharibacteria bacterium]|nr:hypothetical protein [Candidatus Saccharibacteria bacterium]MCB9834620.1 hypothetical protein [Candidatus Nomurabacteria bacterium]
MRKYLAGIIWSLMVGLVVATIASIYYIYIQNTDKLTKEISSDWQSLIEGSDKLIQDVDQSLASFDYQAIGQYFTQYYKLVEAQKSSLAEDRGRLVDQNLLINYRDFLDYYWKYTRQIEAMATNLALLKSQDFSELNIVREDAKNRSLELVGDFEIISPELPEKVWDFDLIFDQGKEALDKQVDQGEITQELQDSNLDTIRETTTTILEAWIDSELSVVKAYYADDLAKKIDFDQMIKGSRKYQIPEKFSIDYIERVDDQYLVGFKMFYAFPGENGQYSAIQSSVFYFAYDQELELWLIVDQKV